MRTSNEMKDRVGWAWIASAELEHALRERVLEAVVGHGPATLGELARAAGLSKEVARALLGQLRTRGEIQTAGEGRSLRYRRGRGPRRKKAPTVGGGSRSSSSSTSSR